MENILILAGGIIPDNDIPALKEKGIEEIFGPGTTTDVIVTYINEHIKRVR
jgi:methylmalonyl-CoA mutase C-terminal domain/subunit